MRWERDGALYSLIDESGKTLEVIGWSNEECWKDSIEASLGPILNEAKIIIENRYKDNFNVR